MKPHLLWSLLILTAHATPVLAETPAPLSGNYLPQVLETSKAHRDSLESLIAGKPGLPYWVRSLFTQPRYVALVSEKVEVAGVPMQRFYACEAKRCEESFLRVLYSADGKRVLLYMSDDKLGPKIFGDPTPQEMNFLLR